MSSTDHKTVKDALADFYNDQMLDQKIPLNFINYYPLGWIKIPFVNLQARKNLLHLHDLNHILMGFDTSLSGEAQLAALELGSGFPSHCRIGYLYSPFALLPGLLICPTKVYQAYIRGRSIKNACHIKLSKTELLSSKISDVKNLLGLNASTKERSAS
jgi:ubiquinone biosynthesis protein Coq4